ncbi:MAG: dependent oxidoreductase, partial [Marmoricola sp.]|nr:dependent oxidoreductase [Marmoricola sp.]
MTPGHAPEDVPLGTTHGTPRTLQGRIHVGLAGLPESADVLVIGLGITGAGVALDAASRGLDVVAVDAEDVAFGTSRWSSKLVHGGLRYLAKGQLDVAH